MGMLEMHPNGYGFLRDPKTNYQREMTDPFVPGSMIDKFGLREGVLVNGMVQPGRKQQGPRLKEITDVDTRILRALAERRALALRVIEEKAQNERPLRDARREEDLLFSIDAYFNYYATQVLHHYEGYLWQQDELEELVGELLAFSRYDAGTAPFEKTEVEVKPAVEKLVERAGRLLVGELEGSVGLEVPEDEAATQAFAAQAAGVDEGDLGALASLYERSQDWQSLAPILQQRAEQAVRADDDELARLTHLSGIIATVLADRALYDAKRAGRARLTLYAAEREDDTDELRDLIELEVDRAEIRTDHVPVGLLAQQRQVDELDQ